ncbi:MAG: RNase J family beta-CASP ribonuclease [Nanoarchaeota archaeon]|nr:RNase J family beta-CASP ribonuclease [Nanoarchaeota archaeon]
MKFHSVGGFSEVGKNMLALELDKEAYIFDCGLYLPPIVELEEEKHTPSRLKEIGAFPNDSVISNIRKKVRGIFVGHAHLDHVGAVPYLERKYNADIFSTPFTNEVLNSIAKDNGVKMVNNRKPVMPNSHFNIGNTDVEFLHVTHSTLQSSIVVVHTDQGAVVYASDFKFDNFPVIGKKPNYARLKKIAEGGIHTLIVDSLYAHLEQKTPPEKIAREMLGDVMLNSQNEDGCIIVTTFSSHIARLKSIVDFGKQLDRKIIFLGRSLDKYVGAAARAKLIDFHKDIGIYTYKKDIKKILRKVSEKKNRYLLVCTGHQGEPGSVLVRMANGKLPYNFSHTDNVIFSSKTIPAPVNIMNRKALDRRLREKHARIFTDIHVSGHAAREDLRDLIKMLKPQNVIPAHGDMQKLASLAELCTEMGYKIGKTVHIMKDGQRLTL